MENNFLIYSLPIKKKIQKELQHIAKNLLFSTQQVYPNLIPLTNLLLRNSDSGKMLRGTLIKLGYDLHHGKSDEIIKIATAFEIIHTAILIHDDIIDQSSLRRGKPTLHRLFQNHHYGISQAICIGDLGFFLAIQTINQTSFSAIKKTEIITCLSNMMLQTIMGEMLDVSFAHTPKRKTQKDILIMQKLKTAYYTFVWPLTIGALLAGAKEKNVSLFKAFGENLGNAFQLQDDLLGIFGETKIVGKSILSDIAEGKNTLLFTYAWQHATQEQKKLLQKYYGNPRITVKGQTTIQNVFINTGARLYTEEKAKNYVAQAKSFIPLLTKDDLFQNYLTDLADFIIVRKH